MPGPSPAPASTPGQEPLSGSPPAAAAEPRRRVLGSLPLPRWQAGAWQPLTWRGVASFSTATFSRLLVLQLLTALVVAGTELWFLDHTWLPSVHEAIRKLPDTGRIENQQLLTPRLSTEPLVENRWLALVVDAEEVGLSHPVSDLRLEFKRRHLDVCSLPGCYALEYPEGYLLEFNRPELESWWEAAGPAVYVGTVLVTLAVLFLTWFTLATLYCPWVRLLAFFKDRSLTFAGSWRISAAALLPAALLVAAAIVLYGLGIIDLIRLVTAWLIHFLLGWAWLILAVHRLPSVAEAASAARPNPFGHTRPVTTRKRKRRNPFGGLPATGGDPEGDKAVDPVSPAAAPSPAFRDRKPPGPFDPTLP